MPGRMVIRRVATGAVVAMSAGAAALHAQQQVQVVVTAVPNPVAPGTCAGIWAEVRNAQNQRLTELDGVPLQSRSYDFSLPSLAGVAWRDNDPASGYLCVQPGVPAVSIQLIATVRSTGHRGATMLAIQSAAGPQVAAPGTQLANGTPGGAANPGGPASPPPYAQPGSGSGPSAPSVPAGYSPPPAAPGGAPGYGQPGVAGSQPGNASPPSGYAPPPAGYAPQPTDYAAQQGATVNAYATPTSEPVSLYAPATATAPSATYTSQGAPVAPTVPAPAGQAVAQPTQASANGKGVGGFLKRFGNHIKQKAGEVTTQTAQSLAGSAERLVDTTLQTGSGMVSTTVAGAGNTARMTIGGAGQSLIPTALRGAEPSDNLASAVAGGRAVLRAMRFMPGTAVLDPSSQELAVRLAGELKKVLQSSPGTYLLAAHVDPILTPAGLPIPAASQQLSEQRAAAVKAVLVRNGVLPAQLIALGYGASQPMPETSADGSSSSARIEIARTQ